MVFPGIAECPPVFIGREINGIILVRRRCIAYLYRYRCRIIFVLRVIRIGRIRNYQDDIHLGAEGYAVSLFSEVLIISQAAILTHRDFGEEVEARHHVSHRQSVPLELHSEIFLSASGHIIALFLVCDLSVLPVGLFPCGEAGNGIDPSKVANQFGADILRLWAANVNYVADVRISESIIQTISEQYRKIRNTFKFMLGNLQDGENKPYVLPEVAPKLYPADEWILAKLENVKNKALRDYDHFAFASVTMSLTNLMVELSNFYLDYAKDILYCEKANSPRRKAVQYVLYKTVFDLCLLFNPILSFTMDEVYSFIPGVKKVSPQLEDMPKVSHEYSEKTLSQYDSFLSLRSVVLKALEEKRASGSIGSSAEAKIEVSVSDKELLSVLSHLDEDEIARLFGVSEAKLVSGEDKAIVTKDEDAVCERCRLHKAHAIMRKNGVVLCSRCAEALGE